MIKKAVFVLFLLASSVSALYDSNITLDAMGVELCLSADGFESRTCNSTQVMTVSGTSDHTLYVIPYEELPQNASNRERGIYYITYPLVYAGVFFGILMVAMFMLLIYKIWTMPLSGMRGRWK